MPDSKKMTVKQMKAAPVVSPRQQVLDGSARETGHSLANYRDGESYELLKDAKAGVGHVGNKPLGKLTENIFPWLGKRAMGDEVPRYQKTMEAEYDKVKEKDLRKAGKPTGYDASMRDTPATPVSTADAMKADQAKKMATKKLSSTPMFQKK